MKSITVFEYDGDTAVEKTRKLKANALLPRLYRARFGTDLIADMTLGMVYDMLIEQANDAYEYPYKAQNADLRAFFG